MSPNFALIFPSPAWNDPPLKKKNQTALTPQQNKENSSRSEKVHFLADAIVGATVNLIPQSAKMAFPMTLSSMILPLLAFSAFLCTLCVSAVYFRVTAVPVYPRIPINFNVTGNLR
jgi:hypothetical protein